MGETEAKGVRGSVLRETFGLTGQKVTRESKKLETVERHEFHC